jgi:hypothetical protein
MILIRLAWLPFRLSLGTAKLGAKAGYRTGRVLGYRRLFVFGAGAAAGLLMAPVTGAELRSAIRSGARPRTSPSRPARP